jgi:hypothetical protein
MTRSSVLGNAVRVDPRPEDRALAAAVGRMAAGASELALRLPDGREIALPATLVKVCWPPRTSCQKGTR